MLGHPLYTNFAITKLFVDYVMHSSFAYRQFNSNFTCGDLTILQYELIHSRNRGTFDHNMRLPRAWQVLDVSTSRLIMLTTPDTAIRTPPSSCDKFVKHAPLLYKEIG
ncbi:hypothetical protein AVEN_24698-1 [Araneus ventricosus]|uniref:Uncharacterized protein n=1 Tax=Araneus ventricosus TaxID=182803 RepID=A0A4Y2RBB8_ARAVE|nr:hypothetical protein AVEN_24698-1 [Araneus ventricosus]